MYQGFLCMILGDTQVVENVEWKMRMNLFPFPTLTSCLESKP